MDPPIPQNPHGSRSQGAIFAAGATIAVAALAAYGNSFHVPLVFDDVGTIAGNPTIRHLWPIWPALNPPDVGMPVTGRPIANLSLAFNYAISGTNVWSYHAVNLLIHILAGLTLFGIVRRTLERWSELPPTRSIDGADQRVGGNPLHLNTLLALAVALIWTLHPLQTESVTYISQRAESLMGLFYLLTLYCFIRYIDCLGVGRRALATPSTPPELRTAGVAGARRPTSILFAGLSFLACLLGMAAKEVMVTAPVMVLLYDRTFVSGTFRDAWRARWRFYLGLASTWLVLAALLAGTGSRGGTAGFGAEMAWPAYAVTQLRAVAHYLRLSIWPHPLVFFYGSTVGAPAVELAADAVVVFGLLAATVWLLTKKIRISNFEFRNLLGFAGAWFFLILAPSSSVVPVATETIAEHRMYLSLAAVVAVVVGGIYSLVPRVLLFICLILAVGCGFMTARRNEDYRSELVLWRTTADKYPGNEVAQYNLAIMLVRAGKTAEAIGHYREALRLKPSYIEARSNLGEALAGTGQWDEAIAQYQKALAQDPEYAMIDDNLGDALLHQGRVEQAIASYEEGVRQEPDNPNARNKLGYLLAKSGRMPEAIGQFEQVVRLQPDSVEARDNLGSALAQTGRVAEAAKEFEAASRMQPDNPELHNDLGCALAQLGRTAEARSEFEAALRLKPDDPEVRANLDRLPNF